MPRSRRRLSLITVLASLAAVLAVVPAGAAATNLKKHHANRQRVAAADRGPVEFPRYIDRGSDYNPGTDNLYFSDTKVPQYIVGPAWFQRWEDK